MATCLVTGASGFIGGHLAERLASRGDEVHCLVRATSDTSRLRELGATLHVADLLGSESLASAVSAADVVYHVAGVVHTPRPAEQIQVNRDGVSKLLKACAQRTDPPRFVLVSSIAASGPARRGEVLSETDPPAPMSKYGRSKLAGEVAAQEWADRVPITIARPGIVFGPRDRNSLPLFRTIARLRVHAVPGLRPPRLSLIHVSDLVEMLTQCAALGACLEPSAKDVYTGKGYYFACAPEYPDYGEFGTLIGAAVGRQHVLRLPVPGLMPWFVAWVNESMGRLRRSSNAVSVDKIREVKAACWACSGEAARRDLNFTPAKTLAERLAETAAWYREQGLL